jgi:hypothetical protein
MLFLNTINAEALAGRAAPSVLGSGSGGSSKFLREDGTWQHLSDVGNKTLVYTNGILTSVTGPGAATKSLTYTNGVLTQVQSIVGGVTTTKTLTYINGSLTGVTTVIT